MDVPAGQVTQVPDTTSTPGAPDVPGGNGQDPSTTDKVDITTFNKVLGEKRAANKEAKETKDRLAAVEAQLKEYQDKEKTDTEKALEAASAAEAKLKAMEAKLVATERRALALSNGVQEQYADYVAQQMSGVDGEELKQYFVTLKKNSPAFFGAPSAPAPGSSAGGPTTASNADKAARLGEIEKELAELSRFDKRKGDRSEYRKWQLQIERDRLKAETGGGK